MIENNKINENQIFEELKKKDNEYKKQKEELKKTKEDCQTVHCINYEIFLNSLITNNIKNYVNFNNKTIFKLFFLI